MTGGTGPCAHLEVLQTRRAPLNTRADHSGTTPIPSFIRFAVGSLVITRPFQNRSPWVTVVVPLIVFIDVDLPGGVAAEQGDDLAKGARCSSRP